MAVATLGFTTHILWSFRRMMGILCRASGGWRTRGWRRERDVVLWIVMMRWVGRVRLGVEIRRGSVWMLHERDCAGRRSRTVSCLWIECSPRGCWRRRRRGRGFGVVLVTRVVSSSCASLILIACLTWLGQHGLVADFRQGSEKTYVSVHVHETASASASPLSSHHPHPSDRCPPSPYHETYRATCHAL
jgi:hypothetical protein